MHKKEDILNVKHSKKAGMTILESMIAVTIFGICVAGMCAIVQKAREIGDQARDHYVAANIAKNRLEKARTFDFEQLTEFLETDTPVDISGNEIAGNKFQFQRTTVMTSVQTNLVELSVTVDIRNRVSRAFEGEEESIKSLFAKYLEPPTS